MSKIFTVWQGRQYVGLALKQNTVPALITAQTGRKATESGVCRVLSGERDQVGGCLVIAHHHDDTTPFTEAEIERVKAEGWKFIKSETA